MTTGNHKAFENFTAEIFKKVEIENLIFLSKTEEYHKILPL